MNNRPKTGIQIHVKDLTKFEAEALARLQAVNPQVEHVRAIRLGCVRKGGQICILNSDGVGADFAFNETFEYSMCVTVRNTDDVSSTCCMDTEAEIKLTAAEFEALPDKEVVPLEEFIRTFGRRLETNFALWYRDLKPQTKGTK